MTMYRKTALVSAEQFLPSEGKIPDGVFSDGLSDPRKSSAEWCLQTLEGRHTLRSGDYICTGPNGERWNVEQSIFETTYEPAALAPKEAPAEPTDQIERWAKGLFEGNAFYAPDHGDDDGGWENMAPNDGGIHDLHMDMARAAKSVWDHAANKEAPAATGAVEMAAAVERLTNAADFLEGDCVIVGDHEVRGNDISAVLSALRARSSAPEAREAIQDAVIAGFLHGVGMGPWDDMHDYIAVCARDYARGEPLPVRASTPDALKGGAKP